MSFTINKFSFIDSLQFLSSSLESLVENLSKDDFEYWSPEFDYNVLDLVKEKEFFIIMSIWVVSKILNKNYLTRKSFIVL